MKTYLITSFIFYLFGINGKQQFSQKKEEVNCLWINNHLIMGDRNPVILKITDINEKTIHTIYTKTLSFSNYPKGVYFIDINGNENHFKILIQ